MKRSKLKNAFAILLIFVVMCGPLFVFQGCSFFQGLDYISDLVQKNYFDENGKARMNFWGVYEEDGNIYTTYRAEKMRLEEVTGFTVSYLQSVYGEKKKYFLVEFEPNGHILGTVENGLTYSWFKPYPSVYKYLDIPEEDRCTYFFDFVRPPETYITIEGYPVLVNAHGYAFSIDRLPGRKIYVFIKGILSDFPYSGLISYDIDAERIIEISAPKNTNREYKKACAYLETHDIDFEKMYNRLTEIENNYFSKK